MRRLTVALLLAWLGLVAPGSAATGTKLTGVRPAVLAEAERDPEVAEVIGLRQAYVQALLNGDDAGARAFWHPAEAARYPLVDWEFGYRAWRRPVGELADSILAVRKHDDHIEVAVRWQHLPSASALGDDEWRLVRHQGRLVAVNRIYLETAGWHRRDDGPFVYHWQGDDDPFDAELAAHHRATLTAAARALGVRVPERVDFYLCRDAEQVGRLFDLGPSVTRVHEMNRVVAAITPFGVHAAVRMLFYDGFLDPSRGNPFGAPAAGSAFALAGGVRARPEWLFMRARELLREEGLPLLRTSFEGVDADETTPFAAHMAAVTDFLLREYGSIRFFEFAFRARHWLSVDNAVRNTFGLEWETLRPEVERDIETRPLPWIETGTAREAAPAGSLLVALDDPVGDPGQVAGAVAAPPGVALETFDLVALEVRRGSHSVHFGIELAAPPPAHSEWGFEHVMVRILIHTGADRGATSIDAGGNVRLRLQEPYHRLIELSPDGVLVKSWRGEWLAGRHRRLAGDAPLADGVHLGVEVPVDLLGEPSPAWRYQVLVSGHQPSQTLDEGVGSPVAWDADGGALPSGRAALFDVLMPAASNALTALPLLR